MGEVDTGQWVDALPADDLWEGDMAGVTVEGTEVLLLNVDGDIVAYENRCAHQQQKLDEGDLDGRTLTCLHHMWSFDAATGEGINPSNAKLTALPCRMGRDGVIQVSVEAKK